jgi:tellurite methyltransferase
MKEDIERWNRKFAQRSPEQQATPDSLLSSTRYLPSGGSALDIAAGSGNNAVWLAQRGFHVTAIDGSINGLRLATALARRNGVDIHAVVADLDHYPLVGQFDLVIVMHYLNRTLYRTLADQLAIGGVLMVKTFNRDFLKSKPSFNAEYVLEAGELLRVFDDLDVLEHRESPPGEVGKSHIICRRS